MRITPRITPYVPKLRNLSPGNLTRSATRSIATGNIPHPRIRVPRVAAPPKVSTTSVSNLTKQSSSGTRIKNIPSKPPTHQANRVHKTPGIKVAPVRAGAVKIPSSFHHQPASTGPHIPTPTKSKRRVKSMASQKNPAKIKFPNI